MWRYLLGSGLVMVALVVLMALANEDAWMAPAIAPAIVSAPAAARVVAPLPTQTVTPPPPLMPEVALAAPRRRHDGPMEVVPASPTLAGLVTARTLLQAGQVAEARRVLTKVQLALVFHPVTPDRPINDDPNIVATHIGTAIRYLDAGNLNGAEQTIERVLSTGVQ